MIISGWNGSLGNHRSGFKVNGIKEFFIIPFSNFFSKNNKMFGIKMKTSGLAAY